MCYESSDSGGPGCLIVGNDVTVGAHAVVIGPISVGNQTKVSPCAVLHQDTVDYTIVASAAMRATLRPRTERKGAE